MKYKYILQAEGFIDLPKRISYAKTLGYKFVMHNGMVYDLHGESTGIPFDDCF